MNKQMSAQMNKQASAIDSLLAGLIDYAGLYPPAALDMRSAVRNYLSYVQSKHASMLGRFVVDLNRLPELGEIVGDSICDLRLSIVAPPIMKWADLPRFLDDSLSIESIEFKTHQPSEIGQIDKLIPAGILTYFEVPLSLTEPETIDSIGAIASAGACVKLRTGGVVAEAFPTSAAIAGMLKTLTDRRLPFKATAGLHHPIRSSHPFTYAPDSPAGTMHGFLNLFLTATLLYFGGSVDEAEQLLDEENPKALSISSDAVAWRSFRWTADQLRTVREEFAISFGSCSFEEPIRDLEALGWLL